VIWLALATIAPLLGASSGAQTTSACNLAMPSASFEELLNGCPRIESHVVWENCDGTRIAFDRWPADKKARVGEIFSKLARGERDLGLRCADAENIKTGFRMYLTAEEAFDVYAAHVAHVFYVESRRLVPWSITARSGPELDELLSSDRYHSRIAPSKESYPQGIQPNSAFQQPPRISDGWDTVCDPRIGFDFLSGKNASDHLSLVGRDERETLENITAWMYSNVGHGDSNSQTLADRKKRAPLEERLRAKQTPYGKTMVMADFGCHSAAAMFYDLARSVNIPLLDVAAQDTDMVSGHFFNRTHRGLAYGWTGRRAKVLWHLDEIYAMGERIPVFPVDERGQALPPDAFKKTYFDANWLSPEELKARGFEFKLETVVPGVGFGANDRGAYENRADFGEFIGYWKAGQQAFWASREYQLCGETMVAAFCSHRGASSPKIDAAPGETAAEKRQEYLKRAQLCAEAYGGCAKVEELRANWRRSVTHSWKD
jgi:hypothetical protein